MSLLYRLRPLSTTRLLQFHRLATPLTIRSYRATPSLSVSSYGSNPPDSKLVDADIDADRSKEEMDDDVVNAGIQYGKSREMGLDKRSDMPDGDKIPHYSGPSIAEKKLDRAVNVDEADTVSFPSSDQMSNEDSGEAVSDSKYHSYSQQNVAKQWEGYANDLFEKPNTRKNTGDFDETQSEMNDTGSDIVGGTWSGSSSKSSKTAKKKSIDKKGSSIFDEIDHKKFFSTRSVANARYSDGIWRDDDTMTSPDENLSDVVGNGMSKVAEKARRAKDNAKHTTEDIAEEVKEVAKEGWKEVKHGAKKVKETVKSAADTLSAPLYADPPVNEDLYPSSDSGNAQGLRLNSSPEAAAERSGASLGEDVNALRKSLFDGPQDMPQGVGKRAKDETGKPLETGTDRS